jgi:hypothetical protein
MDITGFLLFLLLAATVTLVSYAFDRISGLVLPVRFLYYTVRMPGVVLHELAHVAGCLITGAEIRNVVLFSKDGGSVTYAEPKIPVLGTVIISTAPLLLLPLLLALLTAIVPALTGNTPFFALPSPDSSLSPALLIAAVSGLFVSNLFVQFNGWFLLYLYLCTSIILSLAPSRQDLANAAAGITLIAISCILVIASGYGPAITLLDRVVSLLSYAFVLGLVFEAIVAVVLLPLLLIYGLVKK